VNKFSVSVVGGGTGGRLSMKAAAGSEYFKLVSVADLRPEVGAELSSQFPGLQFFTDFREMFRSCPTDWEPGSPYTGQPGGRDGRKF